MEYRQLNRIGRNAENSVVKKYWKEKEKKKNSTAIQFQVIRNSDIFIHKFLRLEEDAYANILPSNKRP